MSENISNKLKNKKYHIVEVKIDTPKKQIDVILERFYYYCANIYIKEPSSVFLYMCKVIIILKMKCHHF